MIIDMVNDILNVYLKLGYHFIRLVKCDHSIPENEIKIIIRRHKLLLYYNSMGLDLCIVMEGRDNNGIQTDKKTE